MLTANTHTAHRALRRVLPRFIGARARRTGPPIAIGHQVTNRCMCSCASCLWRHNDWKDVPTADLKRFYTEAAALGFRILAVTGGEPFLRKDLGELVQHAKRSCHLEVVLFTTGHFLLKRMDEVLPHVDVLLVSLDSARPERHDKIRGLPGLYDRLEAGVKLARKRYPELSIHLNTCVQQGIEEELDDLIDVARALDVHISFDVITEQRNSTSGAAFTQTNAGLPLPELQEVAKTLLQRKRAGAPIVNSERYFEYFARGRPGYRCHLPKLVMYVDGRGNIEDCLGLDRPIANLRDMPLAEIMALPRFTALRRDAERCSSCNSPTMVDLSNIWERPWLLLSNSGLSLS